MNEIQWLGRLFDEMVRFQEKADNQKTAPGSWDAGLYAGESITAMFFADKIKWRLEDLHAKTCADCGKWHEAEYEVVNTSSEPICDTCNLNYQLCEGCTEVKHVDDLEHGECTMCREEMSDELESVV